MNVKDIRRKNLRALARANGGVTQLAHYLGKKQSQLSHLIGTNPVKNVGDRFAAHVETVFEKPSGWLDQEHYDLHETSAIYRTPFIKHSYFQVPLITWPQAEAWLLAPAQFNAKSFPHRLTTHVPLSTHAFALKFEGDSMESAHGLSFSSGCILMADMQPAQHGQYVIVKIATETGLLFRQWVTEGARHYLKPLNTRYPIIELTAPQNLCAVVKVMLLEFK